MSPLTSLLISATLGLAGAAQKATSATERSIDKSVVLAAPVAEVWKAWTTKEGVKTFLCPDAVIELRPFGRYEIRFDPSQPEGLRGSEGAQILSFVPERMLSFSWNAPPSIPDMRQARTFVVLTLTPLSERETRLELHHAGWRAGKNWDETCAYFDRAWGLVLDWCKERFDKGPRPMPNLASSSEPKRHLEALDKMAALIGGTWKGEVKGLEGPLLVEFRYRRHPDGVGIIGEGVFGKGSKHPVSVKNQFGWDPVARSVYYLDSHDSGTVYWGHVAVQGNDFLFVFGPAGGDMSAFFSRSRLADKNTLQTIIRDAEGKEVVGLTLKRT